MKSNRFLKKGYTTGSCAAAAAKAAVMTVLNDEIVITTQITLPKGESISIDITDTQIDGDSVTCTVKKYSGDDPDITNGILVCATVRKNSGGIKIDGGVGVGQLQQAAGGVGDVLDFKPASVGLVGRAECGLVACAAGRRCGR